MRVLVAIKRAIDYNARIRVKPDKVWRVRLALRGVAQERERERERAKS